MKLVFGQQTTKVKQLADRIGFEISMGVFKTEAPLPSINFLSHTYAVSRDTVFKAFLDLKERGIIDSTPGKGYYVINKLKNILLLLDEYTPFKYELYNHFIKRLSIRYKVDLLFHQYNERLFNTILRESIGNYNKYIVMSFDNEKLSPILNKIDSTKLLLLDFGKFDKKQFSYICQDFDEGFYIALCKLSDRLMKYRKFVFLLSKETHHPQSSVEFFKKFCKEHRLPCEVIDDMDLLKVKEEEAYLAIREVDIVSIIKQSRAKGLKVGVDFGLIAYNDIPAYEVIDQGITTLSVDRIKMGNMAAEFVLSGNRVQEYIPTEIHLRNSL
jgi:DNA-binding transcriptional regulator YhcF (GntR family)